MIILIFGKDPVSEQIKEKLALHGENVLYTDDLRKAQAFLEREGMLDLLILGEYISDEMLEDVWNSEKMVEFYDRYAAEPLKVVQTALLYLERGGLKRICYLNSVMASNNQCYESSCYELRMAGAARNMQANLLFNRLRPEGYTMRMFGCGKSISDKIQAESALVYFFENRSMDENPRHEDENRFVMRDFNGREVPW